MYKRQPFEKLPKAARQILLYGNNGEKITVRRETDSVKGAYHTDFEGIINNLERRFRETGSQWMKEELSLIHI